MLAAGTLGTAAGDWVAEEAGLGTGFGSVVLVAVLIVVYRPKCSPAPTRHSNRDTFCCTA
jgi:uncharacterized membrane-anchored protein